MITLVPFQGRITRSIYTLIREALVELGYLPPLRSTFVDEAAYEAAKLAITASNKRFCIEIYNEGSPQAKGAKKVPRIVIKTERILPGEIGLSGNVGYTPGEDNQLIRQHYQDTLTDVHISITYVSNTAEQDRVMGSIIHQLLGSRKSIPYRYSRMDINTLIPADPEHLFLIEQLNYFDIGESPEGLIERIYTYRVTDVLVEYPIEEPIAPIELITVTPIVNDTPDHDIVVEAVEEAP